MMNSEHFSKKMALINTLPEGLVIGRAWLENKGFSRPDIDYYLRAGYLQPVQRGLYRKPGAELKWQQIAYSLQEIGYRSHVGGKTALAEKGFAHYLELGSREIQIYSATKLPKWPELWREEHSSNFVFSLHCKKWLNKVPPELFTTIPFGSWDWPVKIAQPELAVVEWLSDAKTVSDLQAIDSVFEGLTTLSPNKLQKTLACCGTIQTKRLFGWFCDRHNHTWSKRINWESLDLGKGKRAFIKGGSLNKKWQITVPKEMEQSVNGEGFGSEQSLF